jgi:uncharacterized protein (DUF1499 family)
MKLKPLLFCLLMTTLNVIPEAVEAAAKKLPPCLKSPNCVSSQAQLIDKTHFIAPFEIKGNPSKAWLALKQAITEKSRMVITHETHGTLHAEATSLIFRFVDDINVIMDAEAELIHIRSASRTGHSDFGVNRRRIEGLRQKLQNVGVIE